MKIVQEFLAGPLASIMATRRRDSAAFVEFEQALLRVVISGILTAYVLLFKGAALGENFPLILNSLLLFFAFAVVLTLKVFAAWNVSVPRRIYAILADNAATSWFLLLTDESGAIVMGVYLFVTFGYGFRYGRLYLHLSQVLSMVGFCAVLWASPFWSLHLGFGISFLIALAVLPFYVGVLAERLNQARRKAEEASLAKSRFLANMSHEMRTPLNAIIAMAELLKRNDLKGSQREIVDTLASSAQLLLGQIEDVLDEAKIESGRIQIERKPFDLGELLRSTARVVQSQARSKGLALKVDIGPGVSGWCVGDAHHLRQALLNLLANAIKFTHRGEILLAASLAEEPAERRIRFEVKDTGIGIPVDKQAVIFEPFTQADDSISRTYGGTGLGTTIARQLVSLMGGEIRLVSTVGLGSLFWFELPLPIAEEAAVTAARAVVEKNFATAAANVAPLHSVRILVAEDNHVNQRVTQMVLEGAGFSAHIVDSGEEALDALENGNYDLALFDVSMPGLSGIEALKMYRFSTPSPIPVMMLSAHVTSQIVEECERAGAVQFIPKPVRSEELLGAVREQLALRTAAPSSSQGPDAPAITPLPLKGPVIDLTVWEELAHLSPDPEFARRMVDAFRIDCRRLVGEIGDALDRRSLEAVKEAAHALKGGAASLGAKQLQHFAEKLERATHGSLRAKARAWRAELEPLVGATFAALDVMAQEQGARELPPA
jgi:two-component system sensor histidine kinase RpfC